MSMDGYERFKEELMEKLKEMEAFVDYDYKIVKTLKANREAYESITAQSKRITESHRQCFPLFDIHILYNKYLENSCSMDFVLKFIDKHMEKCDNIFTHGQSAYNLYLYNIYNYEYVKDRILLKLINYEINTEFLEDKIYRRLADLAIVYIILMPEVYGVHSTITIKKDLFDIWNVSESEMYDQALLNMNRYEKISTMADAMYNPSSMSKENYELLKKLTCGMYVVTNAIYVDGASSFLCEKAQEELAKMSDGFYIFPASVHEMIFMIKDYMIDDKKAAVSMMKEITKGVNTDILSNEDFLSDNIYYYDAISHTFTIASK